MSSTGLQAISQYFFYQKVGAYSRFFVTSLLGSFFLALMAQFSVVLPFSPIPISLQTLGLFLMIVTLGGKRSALATTLYLAQASLGLPVLAGGLANPAWMLFPTAGYLVGFVICSLVAGYLLQRKENPGFLWTAMSLVSGQFFIYLIGASYLAFFVGAQNAVACGVAPFMFGALCKVLIAASAKKPIKSVVNWLSS